MRKLNEYFLHSGENGNKEAPERHKACKRVRTPLEIGIIVEQGEQAVTHS